MNRNHQNTVELLGKVCVFLSVAVMVMMLGILYTFHPAEGESYSISWSPLDLYIFAVGYHIVINRSRVAFKKGVKIAGYGAALLAMNALVLAVVESFGDTSFDLVYYCPAALILAVALAVLYGKVARHEVLEATNDDTADFPDGSTWKLFRALPLNLQIAAVLYVGLIIYGMFFFIVRG